MDLSVDSPATGLQSSEQPASRYEILARIASGGMATVFVGRARGAAGFSRLVAIKRPHSVVAQDPALRQSFEREAQLASAIHHPHVVSVLDVEVQGDDVSLILDYVEGCTLADLTAHARRTETRLSARVTLRILLDVASGLSAAHALCDATGRSLGIVHRDVSPQNVLVGLDGHARLTDFGIAKLTNDMQQTSSNILKGKLGYMAPEYVATQTFEARSDEYALAVVTWEALTGERLFLAPNEIDTFQRILEGDSPPLSEIVAELAPFDPILARALARDPLDRFESVSQFARVLEECGRQLGWVGSHEEVAAAVEVVAGSRLRQRRQAIESTTPSARLRIGDLEGPRPHVARDDVDTRSLHGPPSSRSVAVASGPAVSVTRPPVSPPARPAARRWVPVVLVACLLAFGLTALLVHRTRAPSTQTQTQTQIAVAAAPPASEPLPVASAEPAPPPPAPAAPVVTVSAPPITAPPPPEVSSSASAAPPNHPVPRTRVAPPHPRPASSSKPKSDVVFRDPG
jgi:serine/threonine protein kinase